MSAILTGTLPAAEARVLMDTRVKKRGESTEMLAAVQIGFGESSLDPLSIAAGYVVRPVAARREADPDVVADTKADRWATARWLFLQGQRQAKQQT